MKLATLEADIKLNAGDFNAGVQRASEKLGGLKTEMEGAAGQAEDTKRRMDIALGTAIGDFIGKMAGALTEAVFEWTSDGIVLASSMEETNSKINTIFGDSADTIHRWAKTTKESFGIGELTAKNYAAQVAGILSTDSKNLTSEEIQNMSMSLVELAGDLSSFHNMSFGDVWTKLLSGLRGETEAIEALGIDLRAANLAAAFGMTEKEWGALDQRTRLLNTYQYIMQETAMAQGDFAKTSESYANQMRLLEENINSLKLALGESLLPAVTELVGWFNTLFGGSQNTEEALQNIGTTLGETYATIDTTTANALALVNALAEMEKQGVNTTEEQSAWNQLLQDLSKTLPGIDELINTTTGTINGGTEALAAYVLQWQEVQRQIAMSTALQDSQNEMTKKQAEVFKLQAEYQAMMLTDKQIDQRTNEILQKAREYYGFDESVENATVHMQLEEDADNPYAAYLFSQLEALLSEDDKRKEKEAELLTAQAELSALTEKYVALEAQLTQLTQQTEPKPAEPEKDTPKGDGQGGAGGGGGQPVTIVLNATLDGQQIAATLVPKVTGQVMSAIDWRFQQKSR